MAHKIVVALGRSDITDVDPGDMIIMETLRIENVAFDDGLSWMQLMRLQKQAQDRGLLEKAKDYNDFETFLYVIDHRYELVSDDHAAAKNPDKKTLLRMIELAKAPEPSHR